KDDPTLLFANAGMNQFKDIILGKKRAEHKRAASCQKCIRVSGKHNDLEEVGKDTSHHTFFEMLGNWSFGDYFKKEAIILAWEFLTEVCRLPKERLWATIFQDDDESEKLWYECTDIKKGRVLRFDEKENFWEMGEVGPCGPSSEIHFDKGEKYKCDRPDCGVNCPCGRFVEVWNLVFMQFNKDEKGNLSDLPAKVVDTGMGFERLTAIMQKVDSNYDTDLFRPLFKQIEKASSLSYKDSDHQESFRVIADHIRALSFAIANGAIPSNEGQGYVVRRILRRAARHGRLLGLHKPFIYQLSSVVVDLMGKIYPELEAKSEHVALVIKSEEERFEETLDLGLELFEKVTERVKGEGENTIPGEEVFKLYDTYGFPLDLTQVIAQEKGLLVDLKGFNRLLEQQKERSREQQKVVSVEFKMPVDWIEKGTFVGYDKFEGEAIVLPASTETMLLLDITPFYAEAGGQVGDSGTIWTEGFEFRVEDTKKAWDSIFHMGKVVKGKIEEVINKQVSARVDIDRRNAIKRNHTATHLLHKALRETLGEHVNQSGSLVAPDRLRFDFTHFKALDEAELKKVEYLVNQKIWENSPVGCKQVPIEEAKKLGAMALFGEKYGDIVRMVEVEGYSRELCGGTHVCATGEIGLFKIVSETGIAAGMRRIEAVTGEAAYQFISKQKELLDDLAFILKTTEENLKDRIETLLKTNKQLEKKVKEAQKESAKSRIENLVESCVDVNGIRVIAHLVEAETRDDLLELADTIREKLKSTVGVLAGIIDKKIAFVAVVTDDLIKSKGIKAGEVIKEITKLVGGTGGGKPHLAQGGGKDLGKLKKALDSLPEIVKKMIK
ncbi:MAG: alanine--tRNA ligase, partial [candidate division Zixibacteria bacterium]|nr:alanine--tRNA ligase [candidate division Zixibacteria bacterium]